MLYQPLTQDGWASNAVLHVRTFDPTLLQNAIRAAVRTVDPRLPIYDVTTLSDRRALALRRDRMLAMLSAPFGVLALALTALGVFGVIAYSVARRRSEIGVRIALGATAADVRRLVIGETLRLVGIGAAIGVPLSLVSVRALSSLLFGIAPQDPSILAACVVLLMTAGCAAGALPANRAARIELMAALRAD